MTQNGSGDMFMRRRVVIYELARYGGVKGKATNRCIFNVRHVFTDQSLAGISDN